MALRPALSRLVGLAKADILVRTGCFCCTTQRAVMLFGNGLPECQVLAMAATLPPFDLTLFLRLSPERALARKAGELVAYECGMDPACADRSFLAHQTALLAVMDRWAARFGWTVIDADRPIEAVAETALAAIREALVLSSSRFQSPSSMSLS